MSKFLGPIHFWLYDKILFQNKLNIHLCNNELKEDIKKFGEIKGEDLESIIDTDNIHGYLQQLVDIVEKSYYHIVNERLKEEKLEILENIVYEFGKENTIEENIPNDIFNRLNNFLLDGMPCDRSLEVLENVENKLIYQVVNNTHEKYWLDVDMSIYFLLRNKLINGMLENSDFIHNILEENRFIIERKMN